jgi:hypothetical protein
MSEENLNSGVMTEAAAQPVEHVAEAQHSQEQTVPLSALQAERQQRQQMQEQLRMMQDHVELLRTNQTMQPKQQQKDQFGELSDDDVLTVGQAKKFVSHLGQQQKAEVEELKMATQYPDYAETVKKYLPEVIKENPELRDAIMNAPNPFRTAYILAKKSDSYLKEKGLERSPQAQKVSQQQQRAGSLSAVGSASPASSAGGYKNMSDSEFQKVVAKNLGYF